MRFQWIRYFIWITAKGLATGRPSFYEFNSLTQCVDFLEQDKELIRIREPVDPHLEMAEITRRVFEAGGPALLFETVKDSRFQL